MRVLIICMALALFLEPSGAWAEFILSTAIIEFNAGGPHQQDIEIISRSAANDYVVSEVREVVHPGLPDERGRPVENTGDSLLLVTPDKAILTGGGRKLLRFVLLADPDEKEHIYRVAVKPVIRGLEGKSRVGLKILVGYEVLVIIRPSRPVPAYRAARMGNRFVVSNTGNTDILFQNGLQCPVPCKPPPVMRVYPGAQAGVTLPRDLPVEYAVWDGTETSERHFP